MTKLLIVARREYLQRVKSKGFVIFTILLPAIVVAYILFVVALGKSGQDVSRHLAVVDLSGQIFPEIHRELDGKLLNGEPRDILQLVPATPISLPAVRKRLRQEVLAGNYTGYLIVPADVLRSHAAEYHAKSINVFAQGALENRLGEAVSRVRLRQAGVPAARIPDFFAAFHLRELKVTPTGENANQDASLVLALVLVMLLYGALIGYGMTFMRSVVEEKTSRVAEVILSSVSAFDLLMGKIVGVAGAALTQSCIWGVFLAAAVGYSALMGASLGNSFLSRIPRVGAAVYICFVLFFVVGFLVYAGLYASVGAIVSSEQEAQQTQIPITLLLAVAFILAFTLQANPSSTSAVVLSEIPFFAPILMTLRITIATPPLWQILLAFALCILTLILLIKVTARIYRVGILMTGKRPTLPELLRWLRYS